MKNQLYYLNLSQAVQTSMLGRIRQPLGWKNIGREAPANLLVLVVEGRIEFLVAETPHQLSAGNCLFLPKGIYYTASCKEEACEYVFIHFSTPRPVASVSEETASRSMQKLLLEQAAFRGKYPYSLPPTSYDGFFLLQKTSLGRKADAAMLLVSKCEGFRYEAVLNRKLKIDLCVMQLLLLLSVEQTEGMIVKPSAPAALQKILTYIQQNYTRNVTLQELSDIFQLSKQYISRLFRQNLSCTVTEHINNLKLYHSLELLKYSTLKVGEVAEILGFSSSYYFCRLFKRAYRMTPTDYIQSEMDSPLPEPWRAVSPKSKQPVD